MRGSVLVIGSGISGMRAASELVQQGFKVFLLERRPTIGGTMAQIDKMYPSNECATCTQLPRMLELTSDQNVVVLSFAEIESVRACDGGFKVGVEKKVRYVDPLKCNACTECFAACPVSGVPMEFNLGRGTSKAIRFWSPFPPRKALIDPETCTYIKEGKCGGGTEPLCQKACEPGAVDFSQKPAKVEIEVGSIIVATGAEEERSDLLRRLGHGRLSNVLTSLEYERLLSGLGPTGGVVRSDDGSAPSRVAWIVAEDFDGGARISSSVALMTAASEALGTLERNPAAEVTVISGRTEVGGRRERQFLAEAEKRGVRVERTSSAAVTEEPGEGLSVGVDGEKRIPADLVVITPRLVPPPGFQELARTLEIEPDGDGLPLPGPSSKHPIHTSREGVFICGAATRSMGIQESVVQACAAAAAAAARLAKGRGTETAPPPAPELLDVKPADEP
ncbi:MAG: CoB--CoM heterodisulfide reductase iron-sulfur subunit A family protein, partial [Planctomycetes bacterium]|nr:CoB--CoM heterodisulfide reductase iron-sulfur subunit A family protein [Planctomycetota bacterium]